MLKRIEFGDEFKGIDFSSKHKILLKDDGGTLRPMDQPFMEIRDRAPGVWQILTSGDYIYLIEGENEAIVIDTGYGIGNLRKMCQTLTDKPIHNCIITHEHFDHLGGITYFEKAYMSAVCKEGVLNPRIHDIYEGIDYPVPDNIEVIEDGHIFDLGGRKLEVFYIPDHAAGSIALLDRKNKLLFSGDELGTPAYKAIGTTVEQYARNVKRLYNNLNDIDWIYGGGFTYDPMVLFRQIHALDMILQGYEGQTYLPPKQLSYPLKTDSPIVYGRRLHDQIMMTNGLSRDADKKLQMTFGYCTIIYYKDKIFDNK